MVFSQRCSTRAGRRFSQHRTRRQLARYASGTEGSVDIVEAFTQTAAQRLASLSIDNVTLESGDACQGWAAESRFDIIVISGALPSVPDAYREQLTVGGRLFSIVGEADQPIMDALLLTRKSQNQWSSESLFETRTSCMENSITRDKFIF